MPLLDSIPVNWFILGTSVLAGVILFLILWWIPDEDEEKTEGDSPKEDVRPTSKKSKAK